MNNNVFKTIAGTLAVLVIVAAFRLKPQSVSGPSIVKLPAATVSSVQAPATPRVAPAQLSSVPVNPRIKALIDQSAQLERQYSGHPVKLALSQNNPFWITDVQAEKIEVALSQFQAERNALETKLAYIKYSDASEKIIVIPAYAEQAAPLINKFIDAVASATNDETAAQFMVGSAIGRQVSSVGQNEVVADVRSDDSSGLYQVTTSSQTPTWRSSSSATLDYQHLMAIGYIKKFVASN